MTDQATPVAATPTNGAQPADPGGPVALAVKPRAQLVAEALERAAEKAKAAIPKPETPANDTAVEATPPANDATPASEKPAASDPLNDHEFIRKMREAVGNDPASWKVLQELVKYKNPTDAFIALKKQRKELSQREREIETRHAETTKLQQELAELDQLRKTNPREFVRRANVTIRELAEEEVDKEPEWKQQLTPLQKEIADLKAQIEERKQFEQRQSAESQTQAVLSDIQHRWTGEIGDKYEYLHAFQPENIARTAWSKMQEHYDETGEVLPLESVLDMLEGEAKDLHDRLTGTKKRASINSDEGLSRSKERRPPDGNGQGPSERGNGAGRPAKPAAVDDPPATLSNADTSDRAAPPERPKSPREYRERAHLLAQRRAAAAKQ